MTAEARANTTLVRDYLLALQNGEVGDALARFFTDDVLQVELPNRLNPQGQQSDLPSILARSIQGQRVLRAQRFDVVSVVAQDQTVAVEAHWSGVLAVGVGTLKPGDAMRAHFAMFFECRGGRIRRQRNYDCFEPW
jgi:ketosteroid isomerase-like protein